jgi:hypothetical protein
MARGEAKVVNGLPIKFKESTTKKISKIKFTGEHHSE